MKKILSFAPGSGGVPVFDAKGNIIAMPSPAEFSEAVLGTLRVSDPVVTDLVLGYKNEDMIRETLFPDVPVTKETGKVPGVGREGMQQWNANRALRGKTNHMEFKTGSMSFELEEQSLGFMIDDREGEEWAVSMDNLKAIRQRAVNMAIDIIMELQAAVAATTSGNYPAAASGAGLGWAGAGDPVKDISVTAREVVRSQIGAYPNVCVFDPTAWNLFRTNEAVRSYLSKYVVTGGLPSAAMVTEELAAAILMVDKVVVGKSIYVTSADAGFGDTVTTKDTWATVQAGNVVLARTGIGIEEPTYGVRFTKKGYPQSSAYRWEPQHSDVYETQHIYQIKHALVNATSKALAGQLIYSIA